MRMSTLGRWVTRLVLVVAVGVGAPVGAAAVCHQPASQLADASWQIASNVILQADDASWQ